MPRCTHIENGKRCGAMGPEGDPVLCVFHDPARAEEAQEMRRKGARTTNAKRNPEEPLPDTSGLPWPPTTMEDVSAWLGRVSQAIVTGEIEPRRARELTYTLRAHREVLQELEQGRKADELLKAHEERKAAMGAR